MTATWMLVPKTAVNLNYFSMPRKNQIGSTRQIISIESEAQSQGMSDLSDREFRLCISAANAAHICASFRG